VRQLRQKLGDDVMLPRFVATERGMGYRWIAEEA
jgi:DNA-binding response OmpR family regulator